VRRTAVRVWGEGRRCLGEGGGEEGGSVGRRFRGGGGVGVGVQALSQGRVGSVKRERGDCKRVREPRGDHGKGAE